MSSTLLLRATASLATRAKIMASLMEPMPSRVADRLETRLQWLLVESAMPGGDEVFKQWLHESDVHSMCTSELGPEPSSFATGTLIEHGPGALGSTLLLKYMVSKPGMTSWRMSIADAVEARQGWWSQALSDCPASAGAELATDEGETRRFASTRSPEMLRGAAAIAGDWVATVGFGLRAATDRLAAALFGGEGVVRMAPAGPEEGEHLRIVRSGPLAHAEIRIESICEDAALLIVSKLNDIDVDELVLMVLDEMVLAEPHPDGAAFLLMGLDSASCIVDTIEMTLTTRAAAAHALNTAIADAAQLGGASLSHAISAMLELVSWVPEARAYPRDLRRALASPSCTEADAAAILAIATTRTTSVFPATWGDSERELYGLVEQVRDDSRFNLGPAATAAKKRIEQFQRLVRVTVVEC